MVRPLHITNANIWSHDDKIEQYDLYCTDVILDKPAPDSLVVDLDGLTVYPGLVNAHDHLELNHYPRTKFREVYDNAHQWGEDVNARLDTEPYKSLRQYPIWDRLFIGGLKNLLCGTTTVAHHNPLHKYLKWGNFPVNVLQQYGWAHSLHFETEKEVQRSYRRTPKHIPWFIHLAEGTDEIASQEYSKLKEMGCVGENTVIIHGVGMTQDDVEDARQIVRGLVWCPSTNMYLLGQSSPYVCNSYSRTSWRNGNHIVLGSDSRLTSDGDLWDEIQKGASISSCDAMFFIEATTIRAAIVLGMENIGSLKSHYRADFIVGRPNERSLLQLVVKGGIPQIGDSDIMAKFPHIEAVSAMLDGVPKSINISLARQIQRCKLKESGLDLLETPAKRFWIF